MSPKYISSLATLSLFSFVGWFLQDVTSFSVVVNPVVPVPPVKKNVQFSYRFESRQPSTSYLQSHKDVPELNNNNNNNNDYSHEMNRRNLLLRGVAAAATTTTSTTFTISSLLAAPALADPLLPGDAASSSELQNGLLESRVLENLMSPPPYDLEKADISYPNYFAGVWNTKSTTTSIQAPCGILFFGGNSTYNRAQTEVGTSISYRSRFLPLDSISIADREFNVKEIVGSTMGPNSVLDVPIVSPNKLSTILAPAGSSQMFQADLITLKRREENINSCEFHCSEVVRQIIAPVNTNNNNAKGSSGIPGSSTSRPKTLLKEIETVSLYVALPSPDNTIKEIRCKQRTATFLQPSQQDPYQYEMWRATKGRPIDVRFYDITYTKV